MYLFTLHCYGVSYVKMTCLYDFISTNLGVPRVFYPGFDPLEVSHNPMIIPETQILKLNLTSNIHWD